MKDLEKEVEDKQRKKMPYTLAIIVFSLLVCIVVMSALFSSVLADEAPKQAYLQVDDVFFVLTDSENGLRTDMVNIDVTAFITNKGKLDAKDVEIIAFTVDKNTNLALDKTTFDVGSIPKDKTSSSEFSLSMPNNDSYVIELIIFENGKIALKGSGTLDLKWNSGNQGNGFRSEPTGEGGGVGGMGVIADEWSLGVSIVGGAVLFVIILLILGTSSTPKKSPKSPSPTKMNYDHPRNMSNKPLFQVPGVTEVFPVHPENKSQPKADDSKIDDGEKQSSSKDEGQKKEDGA